MVACGKRSIENSTKHLHLLTNRALLLRMMMMPRFTSVLFTRGDTAQCKMLVYLFTQQTSCFFYTHHDHTPNTRQSQEKQKKWRRTNLAMSSAKSTQLHTWTFSVPISLLHSTTNMNVHTKADQERRGHSSTKFTLQWHYNTYGLLAIAGLLLMRWSGPSRKKREGICSTTQGNV